MNQTVNIGGDRLGSGAKMNVHLHGFERSTHDLGYIWRNTQSPGTLVPFMVEVGLPGDSFDIDLNADVKTMPTFAPLFASFKLQLDVFKCPFRLYQGKLHNNKLNIGLEMDKIKLPQLKLVAKGIDPAVTEPYGEIQQIHPSSLLAYLGIRGLGTYRNGSNFNFNITRHKNAIPYLAYWDIYKNYYANKQEEKGAMIVNELLPDLVHMEWMNDGVFQNDFNLPMGIDHQPMGRDSYILFGVNLMPSSIYIDATIEWQPGYPERGHWKLENVAVVDYQNSNPSELHFRLKDGFQDGGSLGIIIHDLGTYSLSIDNMGIKMFDLENIDKMREDILSKTSQASAYIIDDKSLPPYGDAFQRFEGDKMQSAFNQQSLALKTYQSDIFNNWISTEWIDGENGINAITAIDTSQGSFSIDTLNLSQKVYNMLNRIAVSGGSYQDWIQAVYSEKSFTKTETPVYCGGLSKEIIFNEVVSTSSTSLAKENEEYKPLGSLAGKGNLSGKHKGGYIEIKCDEPCYIIGIVSITPRIDYSQGNRWDTRLKTMDDLHKPNLDGIGYQDLVTELMYAGESFGLNDEDEQLFSAGKQPAWLNYMTNYNRTFGNFAIKDNQMYMTLNRNYRVNPDTGRIQDLTTYIDPTKFNYAFAETDLKAMNFWVQIASDIKARRKMSAKQIPNL